MKNVFKLTTIFSLALTLNACMHRSPAYPAMTQLEVRQMQTNLFDVSDFKLVMKAILNVLQDEGFVVKNVHLDLGFLNATKEIDTETRGQRFWGGVFGASDARWQKSSIIDATANISPHGEQTKVRINFQIKALDNYGNVMTVQQIQQAEYYQTFFSKISKSIFIQQEKL